MFWWMAKCIQIHDIRLYVQTAVADVAFVVVVVVVVVVFAAEDHQLVVVIKAASVSTMQTRITKSYNSQAHSIFSMAMVVRSYSTWPRLLHFSILLLL